MLYAAIDRPNSEQLLPTRSLNTRILLFNTLQQSNSRSICCCWNCSLFPRDKWVGHEQPERDCGAVKWYLPSWNKTSALQTRATYLNWNFTQGNWHLRCTVKWLLHRFRIWGIRDSTQGPQAGYHYWRFACFSSVTRVYWWENVWI
jgi:hypothetical protein